MYCCKSRFRRYYLEHLESKITNIFDSNLIIRLKIWWVRKNSNLRPPLYQSGILTN